MAAATTAETDAADCTVADSCERPNDAWGPDGEASAGCIGAIVLRGCSTLVRACVAEGEAGNDVGSDPKATTVLTGCVLARSARATGERTVGDLLLESEAWAPLVPAEIVERCGLSRSEYS